MSTTNIYFDVERLPPDILSYVDDQFYDLAKAYLGQGRSDLLKIQEINSVPCFLMTDDVSEILHMDIDCDELMNIKKNLCFKLKDGSFMVKPGIDIGFKCFKEILLRKTESKIKESK